MITGLYAALLAAMQIIMIFRIVRRRWKYRVSLGDGGEEDLRRHVRAYGNFIETVPMALILMLVLELGGMALWIIHWLGAVLIISRIVHAIGMLTGKGYGNWRAAGMMFTLCVYLITGVMCLALVFAPDVLNSLLADY